MSSTVEIRERGTSEWLEFTERPIETVEARDMANKLMRRYPSFEARDVLQSPCMVVVTKTWEFVYSNVGRLIGIAPKKQVWMFQTHYPELLYREQ